MSDFKITIDKSHIPFVLDRLGEVLRNLQFRGNDTGAQYVEEVQTALRHLQPVQQESCETCGHNHLCCKHVDYDPDASIWFEEITHCSAHTPEQA